jgi:hypothetical protein
MKNKYMEVKMEDEKYFFTRDYVLCTFEPCHMENIIHSGGCYLPL